MVLLIGLPEIRPAYGVGGDSDVRHPHYSRPRVRVVAVGVYLEFLLGPSAGRAGAAPTVNRAAM
jgi:hypothetical protein